MGACLLDTSIIIDIERERLSIEALRAFDRFHVAAITVSELWVGVHRAQDPR